MKFPVTCLLFLVCTLSTAQRSSNWPTPPEAADKSSTAPNQAAPVPVAKVNPLQLQREAKELLDLSQSLQPDIDRVAHGILPKDAIDKLKRIEKLSKHLRGELVP